MYVLVNIYDFDTVEVYYSESEEKLQKKMLDLMINDADSDGNGALRGCLEGLSFENDGCKAGTAGGTRWSVGPNGGHIGGANSYYIIDQKLTHNVDA